MLTSKLKETLDKKWENCWPVCDLRPLALLDLISYLFFIKKADDLELIHQMIKSSGTDNFIYSSEIENFTWSDLQNRDAGEIHQLFTKKHGLIDLMSNYAEINSSYSDFFKFPLLIEPTPKLLSNGIEIINIIETNDQPKRENIVEYLFTKFNFTNKNNEASLSDPILKLIISLAHPVSGDSIFDPAAGNGNLLVSAFKYIRSHDKSLLTAASAHNSKIKLSGFEAKGVHLRIAAMNMNAHGISTTNIHITSFNQTLKEKPSLIISSLPGSDNMERRPENNTDTLALSEDSILNEIIERLSHKGRAVVLVRKDLLQNDDAANVAARKKLVDQNNLQGVIMLPTKINSSFSGSAILVFTKSKATSGDVWFYKWRDRKKKNSDISLNDENQNTEFAEVSYILEKWKTRNELSNFSSADSLFISTDYLRGNNYILSFNDYKLMKLQQLPEQKSGGSVSAPAETVIAAKKENLQEFFESSTSLPVEKQKRKLAPILLFIIILICATLAFYWVYSKDNNNYFSKIIVELPSNVSKESNTITSPNNLVSYKDKSENEAYTDSRPDTKKYTVINKAWFHHAPDSNKIKPLYLMPRKGLVLTSRAEKGGFVYVVYTNNKGESTHGWLAKKDLHPVE